MKTIHLCCATARRATLVLILFLTGLDLWAQTTNAPSPASRLRQLQQRHAMTNSLSTAPVAPTSATPLPSPPNLSAPQTPTASADLQDTPSEIPAYEYNWTDINVQQILDVYAGLVNRTLLRSASLPGADHIVLVTKQKLTKSEAIEALQAVLALNGISVINIGEKFVKVVSTGDAAGAGAALDTTDAANLPDLGSYVTHIVQLNYVKPSVMKGIIDPLGKIKDTIPIDDNGILVIRDYAENVKRMLEMIAQVDVSSPQEYTNEVIEIKYALAEDIASALNSLGGQGGATVSIGASSGTAPISGIAPNGGSRGGINGGGMNGTTPFGGSSGSTTYGGGTQRFGTQGTTMPGTGAPTAAGGPTFQQRLQNIIQNASKPSGGGQDQIQVFGQAKIIADARANSLLVFATRADMERIKAVIAKLDVLLSQVLIESVIMDVGMNKGWSFGVSAAQDPRTLKGNPNVQTAGGYNNSQPFYNFLANAVGTNSSSSTFFPSTLPGGSGTSLSYFGDIGQKWDIALQAAANDSSVTVIQRPRIQTSQAKAAQFFVGSSVPYVTGTTYGGAYGNQSSYSQLSVGIELDVTPFINPDGLVVMDILQHIDDISGSTTIDGNAVPTTDQRTLSSEIAVKDKDTVMLGGFIRSGNTKGKTGIPILQDIPLLGALFSSRSSTHDRQELIVLMRPTVLKTPEIAAQNTLTEEQRLPGVSRAQAENDKEEAAQVAAERKAEKQRERLRNKQNDLFTPVPPPAQVDTNMAVPLP